MKHKIIAILLGSLMATTTLVLIQGKPKGVDKSQFKYSLNSCLELGSEKVLVLDYDAPDIYVLIKYSDYISDKTVAEDQLIKKNVLEVQSTAVVTACK
jgi:hypothetical protein